MPRIELLTELRPFAASLGMDLGPYGNRDRWTSDDRSGALAHLDPDGCPSARTRPAPETAQWVYLCPLCTPEGDHARWYELLHAAVGVMRAHQSSQRVRALLLNPGDTKDQVHHQLYNYLRFGLVDPDALRGNWRFHKELADPLNPRLYDAYASVENCYRTVPDTLLQQHRQKVLTSFVRRHWMIAKTGRTTRATWLLRSHPWDLEVVNMGGETCLAEMGAVLEGATVIAENGRVLVAVPQDIASWVTASSGAEVVTARTDLSLDRLREALVVYDPQGTVSFDDVLGAVTAA